MNEYTSRGSTKKVHSASIRQWQISKGLICLHQRRKSATIFGFLILSSLTLFRQVFQTTYSYSQFPVTNYQAATALTEPTSLPKWALTDNIESVPAVTTTSQDFRNQKQPVDSTKTCNSRPLSEPVWEWNYFSKDHVQTSLAPKQHRILIAQYSGFDQYAQLLEKTAPINKAYAKKWNHDFVVLQGTVFTIPNDKNCNPTEERSRFNKINLLQMGLSMRADYDQLLILDADAMIYDFAIDITTLLTNETMLVAQRVHDYDPPQTWNINDGVTLWNLHLPLTEVVADQWSQACRMGLPDNRPFRGDQFYLHKVLKKENRSLAVAGVWDEFYYRDGTVVKHFQRSNMFSWNDTGLNLRLERIENATQEICGRFRDSCKALENTNYTYNLPPPVRNDMHKSTFIEPLKLASQESNSEEGLFPNECLPRRLPEVEWRFNSNSTTEPKRRLLIAQYSDFGKYSKLLEATSPINKAYAKKWGHDLVTVQGATLTFPNDGQCEPPQNRSMHNKLSLLQMALTKRKEYDVLLTLDADAMMYDFDFDVTELITDVELLAAHRVKRKDELKTWNINNGVIMWNLHHPLTVKLVQTWYESTREGLSRGKKEHGDQHYLQDALKRGGLGPYVHGLATEFKYEKGTRIKHFLSHGRDMESRKELIKTTSQEICQIHSSDCIDLEVTEFSNREISSLPSVDTNDKGAKRLAQSPDQEQQSRNALMEPISCWNSLRQTPLWEWVFNNQDTTANTPVPTRRLLIAQYSSLGNYSRLLEQTAPINQAYARKWGHDFVTLRGTGLIFEKDGPCEPPQERSRHNKLFLLQMALSKRNDYDQLLTLDADAMIYDFDRDITELVTDGDVLAAHRANETDGPRTWNINNGIVLWNLHHPMTMRVVSEWYQNTRKGMGIVGEKEHGDQHYLQMTLRRRNRKSYVRALSTAFKYKKATVIKHFVRKNNNVWNNKDLVPREAMIEAAIQEVCQRHPSDCENLKKYTSNPS